MNARVMRVGIAGGIADGMVMAAFSMIALWVGRERVLDAAEPDRAHVLAGSALDGTFSAAALLIGIGVRTTMAILVGTLIATAVCRLVIATDRAICHQDGPGADRSWLRLGWEDVDQVLWDDDLCVLTLTRAGRGGPSRVVLRLPRRAPLVELARERGHLDDLRPSAGALQRPGLRVADRAPPARVRRGEVGAGAARRYRLGRVRGDRRGGGRPRSNVMAVRGHE